ncbi:MAG: 23S rRNA (pseudouridine(1915)-N(3))-methyltransferase RlmH, partial [Bacteroidota bacterium]
MKIQLWSIGKTNEPFIKDGVADFTNRISKYFTVSWQIIPPPKNASALPQTDLKKKEAALILQMLKPEDFLVALDERGKEFTSEKLAVFLQQRANGGTRSLVFLIGGAYGIDEAVLERCGYKWSLS